jgi:hypothetical protein
MKKESQSRKIKYVQIKNRMQQTFLGKKFELAMTFIKQWFIKLEQQPFLQIFVFASVILLSLESLSHRSIIKGFGTMFQNPIMMVYNFLIILLTLSFASFLKRKSFVLLMIFIIWMWLGVTNFILLGFRTTPLTAIDIHIFRSVVGIISVYLNVFQIALFSIAMIIVVLGLLYAFRKLPKNSVQIKNAFFTLCCTIVLLLGISNLAVKAGAVTSDYGNLAQAFHDYGFAYCFTLSIFDKGINEPKEYSEEKVEVVLETIEAEVQTPLMSEPSQDVVINPVDLTSDLASADESIKKVDIYANSDRLKMILENHREVEKKETIIPNIVFVQLESFFDVKRINKYTYSEDPTPFFTQLKKNFSSGYLTVPSIGAGTANTEFEVISGMSLDFFGAGEYPYKTVLKDTTCESICYSLDELDYHNHAIHNNTGTFYSRHEVFPKLGFDSFSSIEYMEKVEYNPLGWAKDQVLIPEIIRALKVTESKDFIYAISVQPHGKYPEKRVDETQTITLEGETDESTKIGFEYFLEQIRQEDEFIEELLTTLKNYKEPIVVVLFGDHLPSFPIEDSDLDNGNKFTTEYVLWSNYSMENIKKDVYAYQLNAYTMGRIGYDQGILTKFHQSSSDLPNYQEELELLQYDMLYGNRTVFGGDNPHIEKKMTMGIEEILIEDVEERGEALFVMGENFTFWSEVYIDGNKKKTLFVDSTTLIVDFQGLSDSEKVEVVQLTNSDKILSRSEAWVMYNNGYEDDFDKEN